MGIVLQLGLFRRRKLADRLVSKRLAVVVGLLLRCRIPAFYAFDGRQSLRCGGPVYRQARVLRFWDIAVARVLALHFVVLSCKRCMLEGKR